MNSSYEAIVIGVSTGTIDALSELLSVLPKKFNLPIMVVAHQAADADDFLSTHLDGLCEIQVKEACPGEPISPGTVYLAPAGYHLLVEENHSLNLSVDLPEKFAIPSIDILFETAAQCFESRLVGIILTGANRDGSQGLKTIKREGGLTIAQDPETADAPEMPRAAIEATDVDHILSLPEIAQYLIELDRGQSNEPSDKRGD